MKFLIKIGCIFLAVGILMSSTAWILGARPDDPQLIGDTFKTEEYENVTSLDLHMTKGTIMIKEGNKFRITSEHSPKNTIESKLETDTATGENRWVVSQREDSFFSQVGIHVHPQQSTVTIELPKDFEANKLHLELGAGVLTADSLKAKEAEISVSAGTLTIDKLIAGSSDIKCGTGVISISGSLSGENMIKCGVGSIDLNLTGNADDYHYSAKVGMGHILINGEEWDGLGSQVNEGAKNAANSFNLKCGVGEISLEINDEEVINNGTEKTF